MALLEEIDHDHGHDDKNIQACEGDSEDEPSITDVIEQLDCRLQVQGAKRDRFHVPGGPVLHVGSKLRQLKGVVYNVENVRHC